MKKTGFIILGLLSLMLLGVWAYLLFFYSPDNEGGVFADFGWFTDQAVTPIEILPPAEEEIPLINVRGPRLRQLTTRPVAGYTELFSTSSEPYFVRYVEAGLGHIYEINMETGEEVRISNTTIPQAMRAEFSPTGTDVAVQSDVTARNLITVGRIADGAFVGQALPTTVTDFTFSDTGELFYAEVLAQGTDTQGKSLNLTTGATRDLFTIPFRAATIGWANNGRTSHYTYTKPASLLMGYLYTIRNNTIVREPVTGNGLNVMANDTYIVYSNRQGEYYASFVYNQVTREYLTMPIVALPEKCTFSKSQNFILYCGYEFTIHPYTFPDDWYKGTISLNDSIWRIDLTESSAEQLVIPMQAIARELDITTVHHSSATRMLYFINKHDKTLWVYELLGS